MINPNISPEEIFQRREEFGVENSFKFLSEILDNEQDFNKRKGAIKYLSLVSKDAPYLKKDCFNTLENILISEDGIEIKCEAAKGLGKLRYSEVLKPLKWFLEQGVEDIDLKKTILKAIYKTNFEIPEIKLFINELDSKYNTIREYVKNQLITVKPGILVNSLIDFLNKENISNSHKSEIIKLIGYELKSINLTFGDLSYIEIKYPEIVATLKINRRKILNEITRILKEEDQELISSVLTILKLLGPEVNREIINFLMNDDFIIKKNAITLAGKLHVSDAVDLLVQDLDNIYNEVSIAAIEALGEIGDLSAVPELLSILNIEDVSFEYTDLDMKLYIMDAIKKIYLANSNASYDYLFSYLNSDNDTIKESIAFLLGEIGSLEFVNPISALLKTRNVDIKKNAVIALGKIGSLDSLNHLLTILTNQDSYWLLKKVAVDAIYNIYQRNWYKTKDHDDSLKRSLNKDVAVLIEYLKKSEDENFKVKIALIKFLEDYGGENALSALLTRVNDFHRVVRIHASNAIKKIEEQLELENPN